MKRNALTDRQVATVKPTAGVTQLTDGQGLYLKLQWAEGKPAGKGHQWRFDYTRPTTGKRNTLSLGAYPLTTLQKAREEAEKARKLVAEGVDPGAVKDELKAQQAVAVQAQVVDIERKAKGLAPAGTLLGVAENFHADKLATKDWTELHAEQWLGMVRRCLPAQVALMPIADVKPVHILADVVRPLEKAGKIATSRTVRKYLTQVFDYAEVLELRTGNPARAVRSQVAQNVSHQLGNNPAATKPEQLKGVLLAIRAWSVPVTRAALQVQAALFQRPSDTCAMKWTDIDLNGAVWTIKAAPRSKIAKSLKGEDHIVPLPRQVVALLRTLKPLTGHTPFVFYSPSETGRAITNDTLTNALRSMGLGDVQTAHGFRATARTMIRQYLRFDSDIIEAQLAHTSSEELGSAYDRAKWIEERAPMLQAWADYLDGLLTETQPQLAADPLKLAA